MPSKPTRAIYVRMPDRLAHKLDRAAERLGATKRDVVAALVDEHLDVEGDNLILRPSGDRDVAPEGSSLQKDVLTVQETAELLRVDVEDVQTLITSGELPARRLGMQWRLSRTAVLAWLGTPNS
jgi:excisionase family DNA binding protein